MEDIEKCPNKFGDRKVRRWEEEKYRKKEFKWADIKS
jgi:hypothetical protein